jgi:hypothetical protein
MESAAWMSSIEGGFVLLRGRNFGGSTFSYDSVCFGFLYEQVSQLIFSSTYQMFVNPEFLPVDQPILSLTQNLIPKLSTKHWLISSGMLVPASARTTTC